jgi:quercetin dioxygenase-like cupin family protein
VKVVASGERFAVSQPGIETRHCFSAGAHYDPSRLGVGALLAVDEHVLAPGAAFGEHAHRGVDIVSWVASGVLRHSADGVELLVSQGQVLVQQTGSGIRHAEANAADEPLRLIQMTLLSSAQSRPARLVDLPVQLDGGGFDVLRSGRRAVLAPAHAFVVHGRFWWDAAPPATLRTGDSASFAVDATAVDVTAVDVTVSGEGELLLWELIDP